MKKDEEEILDIKVLYIDDSEVVRDAKCAMLRTIAREVYEAENGIQGIELFVQKRPDIIFTDVEMPGLNGYEMSKKIKEIDPDAIIVAVTVHEETSELIRFIELGVENYLIKPVSVDKLINTVKHIYKKTKIERELRQKLEYNEKKFRCLVENIVDIIILSDEEGNVNYTNYENREFLGYSPQERENWKIFDFLEEKCRKLSIERYINDIKKVDEVFSFEVDLLAKNGDVHYFEGNYIRLGRQNKIDGILLNAKDVTESRKSKQEIIESRDAAQAANDIKAHAIASISHEIRTPMNGIVGFVDLLDNTELSTNQKFYVEKIKRSSDSLLKLTNNLLDFSKIEANKTEIDNIEFSIYDTVEDSVQIFSGKAKEKKNEIGLIIDKDVPKNLYGDPVKISQVLNNILSNAVKFTENGEILIEVRKLTEMEGKVIILLKISDTGIGIKVDNIKKIFSAFSQADSTISRKYGGTGLGLAISKKLIELMNGEIKVESEFGKGTSFSIMIPINSVNTVMPKPKKQISKRVIKSAVFSDRSVIRKVVSHYAEEEKHQVEEFDNLEKFLERIKNVQRGKDEIELFFVDNCSMKNKTEDMKKIIEENPNLANTCFVLVVDVESVSESSKRIEVIRKPLKRNDLYNIFKKI